MVLVQTPEEIEAAREAALRAAENARIAGEFQPDAGDGQNQAVATLSLIHI